MKEIEVVEFPGFDVIKENFSYYRQKFLDAKILAFRNAHVDYSLQEDITKFFGDQLDWYPNNKIPNRSDYIEDHHKHMLGPTIATKDELMLGWHIEWVENENDSFRAGVWNMTQFDCDYDTGNTFFVDMTNLHSTLSKEEQDFLDKCIVVLDAQGRNVQYSYIKKHWITGEKTLRTFCGNYGITSLKLFDNRHFTEHELKEFERIHNKIIDNVWNNEDIRMVHRWQKGDLLIPDLFKLAHAVTGGFVQNQRRLDGMFAKATPWSKR